MTQIWTWTKWDLNKMPAVLQATFPNTFSWMKLLYLDSNKNKFDSFRSNTSEVSAISENGLQPKFRREGTNFEVSPAWCYLEEVGEGWKLDGTVHRWSSLRKMWNTTRALPTDVGAIATAIVQVSAVTTFTLYDTSKLAPRCQLHVLHGCIMTIKATD